MSKGTLYDKVYDAHKIATLPTGQDQVFIALHLIHEVTSPQAFDMLRELKLKVAHPERTFATVDHIVPTDDQSRPFKDAQAEEMMQAIEKNTAEFGIPFFGLGHKNQGIVHVIGPQLGLTQPGMTIACGDSHTSTHGAFGTIAHGIGTTQVRDVLAAQSLALDRLKVYKIQFDGYAPKGVYPKDLILRVMQKRGVEGGIGYAYEYAGKAIEGMSMEGRMTMCNMSIEGGALVGYCNPDQTTFDYLKGREFSPKGKAWEEAVKRWRSFASDPTADYDASQIISASEIQPMITWGINPGQVIGLEDLLPRIDDLPDSQREVAKTAYGLHEDANYKPGQQILGVPINVVFIGSCTNARIEDLREAARVVKGHKVSDKLRLAIVAPGSRQVYDQAKQEGLDIIFEESGFEFREPGCSMCLAMNPDKLLPGERAVLTSNRNFIGRNGHSKARGHLASPALAAASAIEGRIADPRPYLN